MCQIEHDIELFTAERLSFDSTTSNLPSCSKCHKKEHHNRLNCPYPSPCMSTKFCKNIEKHPDDKQFLKQQKQLAEERKCLLSLKTELANKHRSSISVNNRYSTQIKQTLIDSHPNKYIRTINGKAIEDWRLINRFSILERHYEGNIPSPSEACETIDNLESLVQTTQNSLLLNAKVGKTSVHQPYKKLWKDRGVSWPSRRTRKDNKTLPSTSTCSKVQDGADSSKDVHLPQRKNMGLDDDSQLA